MLLTLADSQLWPWAIDNGWNFLVFSIGSLAFFGMLYAFVNHFSLFYKKPNEGSENTISISTERQSGGITAHTVIMHGDSRTPAPARPYFTFPKPPRFDTIGVENELRLIVPLKNSGDGVAVEFKSLILMQESDSNVVSFKFPNSVVNDIPPGESLFLKTHSWVFNTTEMPPWYFLIQLTYRDSISKTLYTDQLFYLKWQGYSGGCCHYLQLDHASEEQKARIKEASTGALSEFLLGVTPP